MSEEQYKISIHAPREGGDFYEEHVFHDNLISIHAPREGGDGIRLTGGNLT